MTSSTYVRASSAYDAGTRSARDSSSSGFDRFAGACGIAAAAFGILYALAFLVWRNVALASFALMVGALASSAALVALYQRVHDADAALSLWALVLATAGTLGAAIHGGFDLANALHPTSVAAASATADVPSSIDPRGLLTFGLAGLGLAGLSTLMLRTTRFPRPLAYLGVLSALLSIVLYLGRLIILTPTSPLIAGPAVLEGFLVNPLWYAWLGVVLWSRER